MHPALNKLPYKGQDPILVMAAPPEYAPFLAGLTCKIDRTSSGSHAFVQVFALKANGLRSRLRAALKALEGDGIFWTCYPKKTSKKYSSDLSREVIWDMVKAQGLRA